MAGEEQRVGDLGGSASKGAASVVPDSCEKYYL